jgi:hypothetical protein
LHLQAGLRQTTHRNQKVTKKSEQTRSHNQTFRMAALAFEIRPPAGATDDENHRPFSAHHITLLTPFAKRK